MISKEDAILFAANNPYYQLETLPDIYRDDEDVVLTAVSKNGYALEWASPRVRNIEHIVLSGLETGISGSAMIYAGPDLRDNLEFILTVLQYSRYNQAMILYAASDRIKIDKQSILKIVALCGLALKYADKLLQSDLDVVGVAVNQCGYALQYASSNLKQNRIIVLTAVQQNGLALQYAQYKMRNNREVVTAAILNDIAAFEYASPKLRRDSKLCKKVEELTHTI